MQEVSISSLSSAIGTRTFFFISDDVEDILRVGEVNLASLRSDDVKWTGLAGENALVVLVQIVVRTINGNFISFPQ